MVSVIFEVFDIKVNLENESKLKYGKHKYF